MDTGLYNQLDTYREPDSCIKTAFLDILLHRAVLNEREIKLLDKGEKRWEQIVSPNKSLKLAFKSYPERPPRPPRSLLSEGEKEVSSHSNNKTTPSALELHSKVVPARILMVTSRTIRIDKPNTLLNTISRITMNIHTLFKSANSKFIEFPYSIDPRFLSYGFGPSISAGLNWGANTCNSKLSTIEESFEADEREVSGILRRYEHSQDHKELVEQIQNLSQEALFKKDKEDALFVSTTIAHISPIPSTNSLQGSLHLIVESQNPSENGSNSLKDDLKEKPSSQLHYHLWQQTICCPMSFSLMLNPTTLSNIRNGYFWWRKTIGIRLARQKDFPLHTYLSYALHASRKRLSGWCAFAWSEWGCPFSWQVCYDLLCTIRHITHEEIVLIARHVQMGSTSYIELKHTPFMLTVFSPRVQAIPCSHIVGPMTEQHGSWHQTATRISYKEKRALVVPRMWSSLSATVLLVLMGRDFLSLGLGEKLPNTAHASPGDRT